MSVEIHYCAYCGIALPARPPHRAGRPPRYCTAAHRNRAHRERQWRRLEPIPVALEPLPSPASTDELLAATVLETKAAAATFARLGLTARREFACRCEATARDLERIIDDRFPGL